MWGYGSSSVRSCSGDEIGQRAVVAMCLENRTIRGTVDVLMMK